MQCTLSIYIYYLCMLSGNFLRAAQPVCIFAWPGAIFLRAGALQASLLMSCCTPCLHHIIVMNSEAAACMMSQHVCTADHNIPSLHYQLALPCPSCISYSLHTHNLLLYCCQSAASNICKLHHMNCAMLRHIAHC
jgi:hypothetical protein